MLVVKERKRELVLEVTPEGLELEWERSANLPAAGWTELVHNNTYKREKWVSISEGDL
jgi:hypothetical protein